MHPVVGKMYIRLVRGDLLLKDRLARKHISKDTLCVVVETKERIGQKGISVTTLINGQLFFEYYDASWPWQLAWKEV